MAAAAYEQNNPCIAWPQGSSCDGNDQQTVHYRELQCSLYYTEKYYFDYTENKAHSLVLGKLSVYLAVGCLSRFRQLTAKYTDSFPNTQ